MRDRTLLINRSNVPSILVWCRTLIIIALKWYSWIPSHCPQSSPYGQIWPKSAGSGQLIPADPSPPPPPSPSSSRSCHSFLSYLRFGSIPSPRPKGIFCFVPLKSSMIFTYNIESPYITCWRQRLILHIFCLHHRRHLRHFIWSLLIWKTFYRLFGAVYLLLELFSTTGLDLPRCGSVLRGALPGKVGSTP